jgi:hypothetical protein
MLAALPAAMTSPFGFGVAIQSEVDKRRIYQTLQSSARKKA